MSFLRPLWIAAFAITATIAPAERAPQSAQMVLLDVLQVREVTTLMRNEGLTYADDLNTDMLNGQGGGLWAQQVDVIYGVDRMLDQVAKGLSEGMTAQHTDQAIQFFDSDLGRKIIDLEIAARAGMGDKDVEDLARTNYFTAKETGNNRTRLALITQFVAANDLWERNVSGALTANYQFYAGLVDGGGIEMSEDEMLRDVWDQEQEIREDVESWLFGYLLMAYRPLTDAELQTYIDFSNTPAGQSINSALFAGYNAMYEDISYALGQALSVHMKSQEL